MESLKESQIKVSKKNVSRVVEFVAVEDIEQARKELELGGFNYKGFSDGELVMAVQEKNARGAATVVPVIADWLVNRHIIHSPRQAVQFIADRIREQSDNRRLQLVGEIDLDVNGEFYLVAALDENKRLENLYKVYRSGKVLEMWVDHQ